MNYRPAHFPNIGYLELLFSDSDLKPVTDEIADIQKNNFENGIAFNRNLAGNLKNEFELTKSKSYIEKMMIECCHRYEENFSYFQNMNFLTKAASAKLYSLWVNFQKKYEFNPIHNHSGVFSFVIWIDVPFDIKDEMNREESKQSQKNCPGNFEFVYADALGTICTEQIPVDKSWKNKGVFFPSLLSHTVYPFFTSDEYRISVSGNIMLNNG